MSDITFRSDFVVEPVEKMGGDLSIIRAMLVASNKDKQATDEMSKEAITGRINSLMRERHGTPFEHSAMTFYVEAPIFVFREWHRHRIGISINEQSGRYSELPPMFYIPPPERPLVKVEGTKQMDYISSVADREQYERKVEGDKRVMTAAYEEYQRQLDDGIVKESARNCLPVSIYSKMYWTVNPRSLMAFLSLRVRVDEARYIGAGQNELGDDFFVLNEGGVLFPSKPAWEIDACARLCEHMLAVNWPVTWTAFERYGRVAP